MQSKNDNIQNFVAVLKRLHRQKDQIYKIDKLMCSQNNLKNLSRFDTNINNQSYYSGTLSSQDFCVSTQKNNNLKYIKRLKSRGHTKTQTNIQKNSRNLGTIQRKDKLNSQSLRQFDNNSWTDYHCRIRSQLFSDSQYQQQKKFKNFVSLVTKKEPKLKISTNHDLISPKIIKKSRQLLNRKYVQSNITTTKKQQLKQQLLNQATNNPNNNSIVLHLPVTSSRPYNSNEMVSVSTRRGKKLNKFTKYCLDIYERHRISSQMSPKLSKRKHHQQMVHQKGQPFMSNPQFNRNLPKKYEIKKIKNKVMEQLKQRIQSDYKEERKKIGQGIQWLKYWKTANQESKPAMSPQQDSTNSIVINKVQNEQNLYNKFCKYSQNNQICSPKSQESMSLNKCNIEISQKFAPKLFQFKTIQKISQCKNQIKITTKELLQDKIQKQPIKKNIMHEYIKPKFIFNRNSLKTSQIRISTPNKIAIQQHRKQNYQRIIQNEKTKQRFPQEGDIKIEGWDIQNKNNLKYYGKINGDRTGFAYDNQNYLSQEYNKQVNLSRQILVLDQ